MLDNIDFDFPRVLIFNEIPFELIVEQFHDLRFNRLCFSFNLKNTDIRFNFTISNDYRIRSDKGLLNHRLEHYLNQFIQETEHILINPQKFSYCTPELIIEKYFESYIHYKQNVFPNNLESILKNPNIICGRQKGHKTSLISLLENDLYDDIFKDTCIAFSTRREKDNFTSRLSSNTYFKYRNNIVDNYDTTRGRRFSFYIFNNFLSIRDNITYYLYNTRSIHHAVNAHFIVLGN